MLFTFVILCDCDSSTTPTEETETGNYANGGLVAGKDNLVYFVNPADYNKIYSYDEQSGNYERISNDSSSNILIDDDWIYYQNLYDYNLLYRVRLDGTGREKIVNEISAPATTFLSIFIDKEWIYYQWWNSDTGAAIFRCDADGESCETIIENQGRCGKIYVAEDWIYYIGYDDDYAINRVSVDGTEKESIITNAARFMNLTADWVYYIAIEDSLIYRVRTDGSEQMVVSQVSADSINIAGDWIYYTNADDDFKPYKMRTDGSDNQIVYDKPVLNTFIVDDWVYFNYRCSVEHGSGLHRIKADGSQKQDLFANVRPEEAYDASKPLVVSNYYMNLDADWAINEKILNLDMHESELFRLLGNPVDEVNFCSDDDYSWECSYLLIYPEVVINIRHPKDEPESAHVFSLETISPLVSGPRGISVGDSLAQVLEKLPDDGNSVEESFDYQKDMYEYYQILYGPYSGSGPICEIYYDENKSPIGMHFKDKFDLWFSSYLTINFEDGLVSSIIMSHVGSN